MASTLVFIVAFVAGCLSGVVLGRRSRHRRGSDAGRAPDARIA